MPEAGFDNIKKIFVRSTNWIGDAVMTTPALGRIRASFPQAEITIAANPVIAELLANHPTCDRIVCYDKKTVHRGFSGLWKFCSALRKESFDLAILLQNAIEAAIISFLAGIPKRAGYTTDGRAFLLTHRVRGWRKARRLHHTEYYLQMLAGLGIVGNGEKLCLRCTPEEIECAKRILGDGFWVAVNPGATYGSAKRWLPERFARVADSIAQEYGARILIIGGPGESDLGREVEAHMESRPLNLAGKTSVRQLMALLSQCHQLITNDSGPMHVAAAFGVPIVAVFGSTDHTTTCPVGSPFRIVRKPVPCAPCLKTVCPKDHRCMTEIGADDVMEAVDMLMKGIR